MAGVSGTPTIIVNGLRLDEPPDSLGRAFRRRLETPRASLRPPGPGKGSAPSPRYPEGPCRVASPRASMCQCADAPPVVIVIRRPETVKRAGVRSTRSARRRRLQPVPVTRSSTARWTCMIW